MAYLDLEWKIIYVGSAESDEYDQVLDSVFVGPVPIGRHAFVFEVWYYCPDNTISVKWHKMHVIVLLLHVCGKFVHVHVVQVSHRLQSSNHIYRTHVLQKQKSQFVNSGLLCLMVRTLSLTNFIHLVLPTGEWMINYIYTRWWKFCEGFLITIENKSNSL